MTYRIKCGLVAASLIALSFASSTQAQTANRLLGGPTGLVTSDKAGPLEGMMVQLIAKDSGIRTTVYSHTDGRYEFPKMAAGTYLLRIALPREYLPYVKQSVAINGPTRLDDIVLKRVTETTAAKTVEPALLPPTTWMASQLSGAEWLMNLPGTAEEKHLFAYQCNLCHSFQQIFRSRFDEDGWRKVVYRMTHGIGSPLININPNGGLSEHDENLLVNWLTRVRGPNSPDAPLFAFPRPKGRSTDAIITEYELPRLEIATHDVSGDANGNIWYSTHRSSWIGRLDPRTGKVTQFHIPLSPPPAAPGTHWIHVDPGGIVWASENWTHNMVRLDPKSGDIKKIPWPTTQQQLNTPMGGNYAMDPEGFIWDCRNNTVRKVDPRTGKIVKTYPTKRFPSTYGSAMSADGRYFGGGAWPNDGVVVVDTKTGEVFEPSTSPDTGPSRGEFDLQGNYWSGGRGGPLIEFDMTNHVIREFYPPVPYGKLYTAVADKNGEVWAGNLQAGRYLRFNPKTEQFTEYLLPEPYAHDREPWIDNSTNPVSVWHVDHEGYIVHIQPLE